MSIEFLKVSEKRVGLPFESPHPVGDSNPAILDNDLENIEEAIGIINQTSRVEPVVSPFSGNKEERRLAAWKRWSSSKSSDDLALLLTEADGLADEVAKANPKLNSSLLRGQAKTKIIEAAQTFDPKAGASLSTHIRNHLKPLSIRAHNTTRAIPKGRYVDDKSKELYKYQTQFFELNNRLPTEEEISTDLKITPQRARELSRRVSSYEVPESGFKGQIIDEDPIGKRTDLWFNYHYEDLSDRDKKIIDYRLGRNGVPKKGLDEIAKEVGISTAAVHKVCTSFSTKLDKSLNERKGPHGTLYGEDYNFEVADDSFEGAFENT